MKLRLDDTEGARKDLNEAEGILDNFDSVETEVHAAFYRRNADYFQVESPDKSSVDNSLLIICRPKPTSHRITKTLYST